MGSGGSCCNSAGAQGGSGGSCCATEDKMSEMQTPVNAVASNSTPVKLTSKAIEMTKKALQEEGLADTHGLRVAVRGGGCSGLEYALDFADAARPGDTVLDFDGLKIYIDIASVQFLSGTEIDYVSGLQGSGFKFNNPNARRTCGCGSSFS